jgi:putative oligomerization/nucleic acid binding protein
MGFFKDMKNLKKLGDHHGGMPSMKSAFQDIHAVADDRGEAEVLENGVPAKAVCKGFATPVPDDRFAMQIPLEVHPPQGAPYELNYVFPTARMKAAITVGMEIPIKVLPDDPQRIAVQWDAQQASIAAAGGDMAAVTAGLQETYGGVADAAMRQAQAGTPMPVPGTPAPALGAPAGGSEDAAARLSKLGKLREDGLIDDDEYEAKKAEILKEL